MRVVALVAAQSGLDTLEAMHDRLEIERVIGLSEAAAEAAAGHRSGAEFCRRVGIAYTEVESYGLTELADRQMFEVLDTDILLVLAWQRLVPDWVLERARIGGIGVHGSADGITSGRGRSPQNWALILGSERFSISIFWLSAGIDEGDVIDSMVFELTEADDIATSYKKVSLLTAEMILRNIENGAIPNRRGTRQTGDARYLPQRRPEDGEIDWSRSTVQIDRFVRALARPYPGAFVDLSPGLLRIWKLRPFTIPHISGEPGEIVQVFEDQSFIVGTGDGLVLVTDYDINDDGVSRLKSGQVLPSYDFRQQMRRIIDRHIQKYPSLPLAESILNLAETD